MEVSLWVAAGLVALGAALIGAGDPMTPRWLRQAGWTAATVGALLYVTVVAWLAWVVATR